MTRAPLASAAIAALAFAPACSLLTDEEKFDPAGPPPAAFRLIGSAPEAGSKGAGLDVTIELRFSNFPDPASLGRFGPVQIRSGRNSVDFDLRVDLLGRAIRLQPKNPLAPSTTYEVVVSEAVLALDGTPAEPILVSFETGTMPGGRLPQPVARTYAEAVAPIFDVRCATAGCHATSSRAAGLSLDRAEAEAELIDVESPFVKGFIRVKPGDPGQSYLLRKLLGTPDIRDSRMPIGAPLSEEELRIVSDWIETR